MIFADGPQQSINLKVFEVCKSISIDGDWLGTLLKNPQQSYQKEL